jgi:cytochrome c peroxidase
MEERRAAVRLLAALGLGAAVAAAAAGPALACDPPLEGTRLESPRHVLTYKLEVPAVGKHFGIDVGACARSGKPPESLAVDAQMPEHRHGMNYRPEVKKLGPGRWRAEGLQLHMPGRWQLEFVVDGERMTRDLLVFTDQETKKILSHGPWPPAPRRDPTNRVSGKPEAIALGERLFFEPRLSGSGSVLCATCHAPFRHFQDGRARAFGLELVERNTPTLVNAGFYRWYGWDGAQDSLWAQSIRPILDPREMRASASHVARVLRTHFATDYAKAFNRAVPADDEEALVDAGKALAAFQETLVSGRTPFDDFRDALERGDAQAVSHYPMAAQRGLAIFVGKGNCSVCHFGASFTNSEFADTGIRHFVARGRVDGGRFEGIRRLKASPYNLLGRFSDDRSGATATGTKHVELQHRNFGEFRVPGLRGAALSAPYMHDGSLATLRDVVRHYSELDEERLHADGERILRPLKLSAAESEDLLAFLESLSQMVRRD